MVLRNSEADAGRKGAPSQTKITEGIQMEAPPVKGAWSPAYGSDRGAERPADRRG